MGCDIHFYVEKRNKKNEWVSAEKWVKEEGREDTIYKDRFYRDRNYNLFAILADVRNGRGFAGIESGEGFYPIASPRGVPRDADPRYKAIVETWGEDGHSHSYFTLEELLAYDWTQKVRLCGVVNAHEYYQWVNSYAFQDGDGPREYCLSASGATTKNITETEMKKLIRAAEVLHKNYVQEALQRDHRTTYCKVWWSVPYYKTCKNFLSNTIPRLLRLGAQKDVRVLFFFDN